MEILDTGATTGVPPRGLDTRQSFPDPVPEDVGVRRQWLSCRIGPPHVQHGAEPTEITLSRDWLVKPEQSARELKFTHPKRGAVVAHGCRPKRLVSGYFRGPVHLVALAQQQIVTRTS